MFGWFKRRSWKPEIIPELKGQEGNLRIKLMDVSCLRDRASGDRKYASPDFGLELLLAIHEKIGSAKSAHARLRAGSTISCIVRLPRLSPIAVELSGKPKENLRNFESDIADLLLNAFSSAGLMRT